MIPLNQISNRHLGRVKAVFTDIDDTLTTEGRLTANAYTAMCDLQVDGIDIIPITGRPAGWCDLIARLWPVRGVVGENGAFYFQYDRKLKRMNRYYADSETVRIEKRKKLAAIRDAIIGSVQGAAIAADQQYRETDLAIDFAEDVPQLSDDAIDQIVELFLENGATAKVSSIHVNGWIGSYNKLTMTRKFISDCLNSDLDENNDDFIFVGDSPNDAPMFEYFHYSIGVANVIEQKDRLPSAPKFVTQSKGGVGFTEVAQAIINARH